MTPPIPVEKQHYLVVVADEYQAIVYVRDSLSGPLKKLRAFTNESARMKTADIISDRGGRSFDSHGEGRHTMAIEKDGPKQHLARTFARTVAEHIAADVHKGTCRGFALVAAPRFLGVLRREVDTVVGAEPYATVNKDVVGQNESVIDDLLARA